MMRERKEQNARVLVKSRLNDTKVTLRTLSLGATSVSLENHADYPVHSKCSILGARLTPSCNGLTCLYSETFVYVINPATRWYRELPEARVQALLRDTVTQNDFRPFPLPGFGKDNITGIYKLVWLYNSDCFDLEGQTNTCEVFSFDTNNTWRHDVIVSSPHPTLHHAAPAHAYGCLHWFIDAVTETQILSFDLHTETFTVLMAKLPLAHAPHDRIAMCTLNDRLCLSEDKGDIQTIWSLNQGNMTWDKIYSINLRSTLPCIEEEFLLSEPPITSLFNNNLLLYDCCDDKSKLVLYNYRLNSFSFFTFSFCLAEAISFSQSLITLP
ncbi:F-box protein [Cardamine amara subsp. amara]|uniref:F-box protein n=1 Tax=Cardamine amara subsp. amara TaxID=228776 RepID=A0ABD1AJ40_CARAN